MISESRTAFATALNASRLSQPAGSHSANNEHCPRVNRMSGFQGFAHVVPQPPCRCEVAGLGSSYVMRNVGFYESMACCFVVESLHGVPSRSPL